MADGASIAAMMVDAVGAAVSARPAPIVVETETRVGGRVLNASQSARLDRATRLAAGSLNDRRRAARIVRSVQDELAATAEAEAVQADMERAAAHLSESVVETVAEAEFLRDQDGVALRDGEGQLLAPKVRHVTRRRRVDGIASLFQVGALCEAEKRWGDAYRDLYASALPPIGYSSFEGGRGGSVDKEALMCAAIERGQAAVLLARIRVACGEEGAAVLEAVAGRGETIRGMGFCGRQALRITQALRDSLKIADFLMQKSRSGSLDSAER